VGRGSSAATLAPRIVAEPATDDGRLVAAVRQGDDRAFEALYSRYQRRIHAYVMGMVKDHGRAEDVTQEVFVSALRRMRETERPIAFKPWVYEIAKNACIDQFRRSRRAEEVSLQAGDGLAPADYGRLVGPGPAPDDAVAAKQELDNLCGAFGGLSDTHHEILVLRELEGLSYREIGDRMGMSRPAVESTLFRARRRLNEEHDELVSGARCVRIQNLIATAASSHLGTREQRRLSRHVAYCQPCRREALAAGLDAAILTRVPLRKRAAAKVAALLPFPVFGRWRGSGAGEGTATLASSNGPGWMAQLPFMSDQLVGGWAKLATAAALLLAGVGAAGVGTQIAGGDDSAAGPERAAPRRGSVTRSAPAKHVTVRAAGATKPAAKAKSKAQRAAKRRRDAGGATAQQRTAGSGGTTQTAASGGGGGGGTAGGTGGTGGGGGGGTPSLPSVKVPSAPTAPAAPVTDAAGDVTEAAGDVTEAAGDVTEAVQPVVDGATQTVQGAADQVSGAAGQAGGAVQGVTGGGLP
jgi:RNA polymerase sigma factor (sigma-70 family)